MNTNPHYPEIAIEGTLNLDFLLHDEVKIIYVGSRYCPLNMFWPEEKKWLNEYADMIRDSGKKLFLALPLIIVESTKKEMIARVESVRHLIDGISTADYGLLAEFAQSMEVCWLAQVTNGETMVQLMDMGVRRVRHLLPYLDSLGETNSSFVQEIMVFGRMALNYSPYCIHTALGTLQQCNRECMSYQNELVHCGTGEGISLLGASLISHRRIDLINVLNRSGSTPDCLLIQAMDMDSREFNEVIHRIRNHSTEQELEENTFNGCAFRHGSMDMLTGVPWRAQIDWLRK